MVDLAKVSRLRKILVAFLVLAWIVGLQLWILHSQRAREPVLQFPKTAEEIPQ